METWGNVYWPIFLIAATAGFLSAEIFGLVTTGASNTLSNWIWVHLNIMKGEKISQWSALDFLLFCEWMVTWIWLTFHFFFHRFV